MGVASTHTLTDRLFDAVDVDDSESLSKEELEEWFSYRIPNLSVQEKENILHSISDGHKGIPRKEFRLIFKSWTADQLDSASATIVKLKNLHAETKDILLSHDLDCDGHLSKIEIRALLNPTNEKEGSKPLQLKGLFNIVDPESKGKISVDSLALEFLRHYKLANKSRGECPCILCDFIYSQIDTRYNETRCLCCSNQLKYMPRPLASASGRSSYSRL
mmetsp:Transcript_31244/g.54933  ORF Transcript_31244/g.54933 Transcript_31244/m.54933 type:complete len:218 (+) Transcript_31244:112-765(+)